MAIAIGHGWRGGPRLLFLAPDLPLGLWTRCETCGRWASGHPFGILHHIREYHQRDKRLPRFMPAVDPRRNNGQN